MNYKNVLNEVLITISEGVSSIMEDCTIKTLARNRKAMIDLWNSTWIRCYNNVTKEGSLSNFARCNIKSYYNLVTASLLDYLDVVECELFIRTKLNMIAKWEEIDNVGSEDL